MNGEKQRPSIVGVAMRDLARLRQVGMIVARHGFGAIVMRTAVGRRLFGTAPLPEGDAELAGKSQAVRFTKLLAALGPTYIKLGQILSMRRDLFPEDYIAALETLQDKAPPLPFADVRAQVERALDAPLDELYASFDEAPLATASIAQTHLATTLDGERVVVKVQRPGIEATMRSDLDLLYFAAQLLEASIDEMRLVGVVGIVEEFERGLLRELNFQDELANLLEMRKNLAPERRVTVPVPHPELSSRAVLTMQYFAGRAIRKVVPRSPEARQVVTEVLHAAMKQVFVDGFFHGDPHAGNVLLDDEGTLCMIDLGMVGRLTQEQRDDIVTLAIAAAANDSTTVARVLLKMGTPTQRVNLAELKAEIERVRAQFLTITTLAEADTRGLAEAFARAANRFRIKLATEYTILIKAAATVEGIVRSLDPEVDLVAIGRPYLEDIVTRKFSPERLLQQVMGEASGVGALLRSMPGQVDQLFHDFQTGNVQIRAVTPALDELPGHVHRVASRLSLALFATATTVAAALVLPRSAAERVRLVLAIVLAAAAAVSWLVVWGWHFVGRGRPLRLTPLLRFLRR